MENVISMKANLRFLNKLYRYDSSIFSNLVYEVFNNQWHEDRKGQKSKTYSMGVWQIFLIWQQS